VPLVPGTDLKATPYGKRSEPYNSNPQRTVWRPSEKGESLYQPDKPQKKVRCLRLTLGAVLSLVV
jgi:hypothetical protein